MRVLKFALSLLFALAAHGVATWMLPEVPRILDLFLIVAVLNALGGSTVAGLLGGVAAGLSHDALSGRLFGLHGFADTIVGYTVARAAQRLDLEGAGAVFVTVGLATLLEEAVLVLLALLFVVPAPPDPVWVMVEVLANSAAGTLFYLIVGRARSLREHAERRRMSKIRL